MLKKEVIAHFGSGIAVAQALSVTKQAVSNWPKIVPQGAAYKLQFLTGGLLRVDPALYPRITKKRGAKGPSKQIIPANSAAA